MSPFPRNLRLSHFPSLSGFPALCGALLDPSPLLTSQQPGLMFAGSGRDWGCREREGDMGILAPSWFSIPTGAADNPLLVPQPHHLGQVCPPLPRS